MRSQGRRSQHKEKTEEKEKKKTAVAPNNVPSRPSRLSHRVQLNYTPAAAPPPAYIVIFIVYFSPHPPSPPLYGHAQRPAEGAGAAPKISGSGSGSRLGAGAAESRSQEPAPESWQSLLHSP
ncbi:unnamed protein product [Bursaphelenchus xylophilus]|uniref:(pine wood nematode) hypothetical protein n=1 Tax=Bursaphelenchus xylophilus TaxID=6326 RepID=A0A7I8XN33_BURXY|nr:unnamed protein product [Bursaphelenchus xylophilus]CAG9089496.1 unnamed protein product [Bursaphelenchus xylophilus]